MIEELAMVSVLAGMGIYFVKSTELPKELIERSKNQTTLSKEAKIIKKTQNNVSKTLESSSSQSQLVIALEKNKKLESMKLQEKEINELTIKITTLEQEIKVNNQKNSEIQQEISLCLKRLEHLSKLRIS